MNKSASLLGYYSALVAFVAAAGYCVAQVLQVVGILTFPLDAILIYGFSLGIAIPFMLALLALHHTTPEDKKIWSHAALLLGILYAVYATLVYVVQLGVAIPKTIRGESDPIQVIVLTQHSMFWTLDALSYICLGLATFVSAFSLSKGGSQRSLRWFFLANGFITPVIALVYFYPEFSIPLLFLGSPWMITAPGSMLLLALYFKKQLPSATAQPVYGSATIKTVDNTQVNFETEEHRL